VNKYLKLIRVNQWYKNLLVLVAFIFEKGYLHPPMYAKVLVGLFLLCILSSANYIINDLLDRKKDVFNKFKQNPLANDSIKVRDALVILVVLLSFGFLSCYFLSIEFFTCVLCIFLLSQLYNLFIKKLYILDVIVLSSIYVLRVFSGYFLIGHELIFILILPFSAASSYLMVIKKRSILLVNGRDAAIKYRSSFKFYNEKRLEVIIWFLGFLFFGSYLLYFILSYKLNKILLFITLPLAAYVMFRFIIYSRQHPRTGIYIWQALKDVRLFTCTIAICVLYFIGLILYTLSPG